METKITKMEAIADVIAHFPKFTEACNIYGNALIQLVPEHDVQMAKKYLDSYHCDAALTITAANAMGRIMTGHNMFNVNLDLKTNIITYEGFNFYNETCGIFTEREALACALIMIHANFRMMKFTEQEVMVIDNFKYSDTKFLRMLD